MPRLLLAFVGLVLLVPTAHAQTPPADLSVREGDRSVIVRWTPVAGALGYKLYRSADGGTFEPVLPVAFRPPVYTDLAVTNGVAYRYRATTVAPDRTESGPSSEVEARPRVLTDPEFLALVARTAFDFLWNEANPRNGLVRDRAAGNGASASAASIASVGFALTAYGVAAEEGWITRAQARERTLTTLEFFWRAPQGTGATGTTGYKGFFYHFLNMETGVRSGTTELSTIDTALLLAGVRYAGQFFDGADADEARIRALADSLYDRVDWGWASPRPPRVTLGWSPESGFLTYDWGGYNEAMILYLQALGSRTHPVSANAWAAWTGTYGWQSDYSAFPYVPFGPLFGHQYSHVWVDFRGLRDAFMRNRDSDYFENSRRATLAQRLYAIRNPLGFKGYDADGWGITASDDPEGYSARGAPPAQNDDGTLVPTGPGGSYPFAPTETLAALRAFYDRYRTTLWGPYGFRDAINPTKNWVATDYIGIDQGPIALMIPNGQRDAVWRVAMRDTLLQRGLRRAGFVTFVDAQRAEPPVGLALQVRPNPAQGRATARVTLPAGTAGATLDVYDALGRHVRTVPVTGSGDVGVDLAGFASGAYVVVLRAGAVSERVTFVVAP